NGASPLVLNRGRLFLAGCLIRPPSTPCERVTVNAPRQAPLAADPWTWPSAVWGVNSRVRRWRCRHPLPSELDVRVAPHPAQAFTNAPRGTRPLWSVLLGRGSADGSWRATTPCCRIGPDRLGCARSDGGSGSLPRRFAGVDRRPRGGPPVPSTGIRSDCDPSAFGPVASPAVPPGTVPTSDRRD